MCRVWEAMLASPMMRCFVIEQDGRLVSSCVLTVIPQPDARREAIRTHRERCDPRGLPTARAGVSGAAACAGVGVAGGLLQGDAADGAEGSGGAPVLPGTGFEGGEKTGYVARPGEDDTALPWHDGTVKPHESGSR